LETTGTSPKRVEFFGGKGKRKGLLPHALMYARGVDSVPAMLTPGEAVLTPGAAEELGRRKIRRLNKSNPPYSRRRGGLIPPGVMGFLEGGFVDPLRGGWTPQQQAIIDRITSGRSDYTFGPGSPDPTREDLQTYVGGRYSPAGGFAIPGGVALAPSEYNLFTPSQRQALGIMDVAPQNQAGQVERYFPGGRGNIFARGFSTLSNPGRALGTFWSDRFGGARDLSPAQLGALGVPFYGEGSPVSQALGPVLERGFPGSGSGGGAFGLLDMTPGTGGPTRNVGGLIAGVAGNALIPGLGALTGPAARWVIQQIQRGHFPQLSLPRPGSSAGGGTVPGGSGGSGAGYSSPDYLRGIGYDPGQGTGSLWPGTPSGGYGGYGVGGAGGSFFGQLSGVRGGPLGGAFQGLGSGGGGSVSGGAEAALASTMLQNLRRGQGTPIGYSSPALAGAFMGIPGATMVGPQNYLGAMQMLRGVPGLTGPINQGGFTGRAIKGIS
jgi:hypothetical protein